MVDARLSAVGAALSLEPGGEVVPVLRDAERGAVRWRANPLTSAPASVFLGGAFVFISHLSGMAILRRSDGALVADVPSCATAQLVDGRLFLGGLGSFTCFETGM